MAGSSFVYVQQSIATGDAQLDRFGIRGRCAYNCLRVFGLKAIADLRVPRAMMLIFRKESGGNPAHYLGDATLGGGPSIGPGQVYRTTAKALGLWSPPPDVAGDIDAERAAYAALSSDEGLGVKWAVKVFADKLKQSAGDIPDAIRRYNGSGSAAEDYRDSVLASADSIGWDLA